MRISSLSARFLLLLVILVLVIPSGFIGCVNEPGNASDITSISSFRDIPGITPDEIKDIEKILAEHKSFIYGMTPSTETFIDRNGEIRGFSALFSEWLTELFDGVPFEPKIVPFEIFLADLASFETSFTGDMTRTEARVETYYMTESPIATNMVKAFRLPGNPHFSDIIKKRPLKLGFIEGTTTINQVTSTLEPGTYEVIFISGTETIYHALKKGDIDAFFNDARMQAAFDEFPEITAENYFPLIITTVALTTQNPDLAPIINAVQKALQVDGVMHNLTNLYNQGYHEYLANKLHKQLSPEEQAYVESKPLVRFGSEHDNYPIGFYNTRSKQWQGIAYDILDEITSLTGIRFEMKSKPSDTLPDLIQKLESGNISLITELPQSPALKDRFLWSDYPVISSAYMLISRAEMPGIKANDVLRKRVGLIEGYRAAELFHNWFPNHINTVPYANAHSAFTALGRGDIDLLMGHENRLLGLKHYEEQVDFKANLIFDYHHKPVFVFNIDETVLHSIFDKALLIIDTDSIALQWTSKVFDYQAMVIKAQRPWLIGTIILLSVVLILLFILSRHRHNISLRLEKLVQERTEELEKRESEIVEVNERARLMLDLSPLHCEIWDSSDNIIDCNEATVKFFGLNNKEEFIKGYYDFSPEYQLNGNRTEDEVKRVMAQALEKGRCVVEWLHILRDGTPALVEATIIPIIHKGEQVIIVYNRDLREYKKMMGEIDKRTAEMELQLLKLNLMTDAAKIGLWDMDVVAEDPVNSNNIFMWSQEFRQMLGYSDVNDFPNILSSWSDRLHPEDKEHTLKAFSAHLTDNKGKTPYNVEYRLKMKTGEYRYFNAFGETLRNDEGVPLRTAGALMDITERKIMEQELADALYEAQQASKAKGDFLSVMSHEMRTPMNAIIGMTTLGKKANDIAEKNIALNKISDASKLLLGVINDILDMAKIEANKLELVHNEYDFEKMLQKIVNIFTFSVDEKQQTLDVTVDNKIPPFIIGDEQRLAQVMTNLMSNAVKFTPKGGSIKLDVAFVNDVNGICELKFTITDSGIGISPEQQEKLFQAFEQAESGTSRVYGGTGLGLAISKNIIELMDGTIWVESELGKGSKFMFNVKLKRGDGKIAVEKATEVTDVILSDVSLNGKKMLLVEDIEINREIVIALLEDTGIEIDCAENGLEALDIITANPDKYDIVFMDVQMPKMDGQEATRRIRALPASQREERLPIIAMTANVFTSDVEECIAAGMDEHLSKPLDMDKVIEVLHKYLFH